MIEQLKKGSKVYFIGICGTAMASLAGLMKDMGFQVIGSDQQAYPPMSIQLERLGISYYSGYHRDNILKEKPDFVIVGNVISKGHVEVETFMELKIPFTSLPKALGYLLLKKYETIVVAGTHGKTTTTSAMAWVLETLGQQPGFLIGGIPKNFSQSFKLPQKNFFVIEGDEYDTAFFDKVPKFFHYHPSHVILTSIEFDHADIYSSIDQIKEVFNKLVLLIPENGNLIYHGDDPYIQELENLKSKANKISYGFSPGCDYQIVNWSIENELTQFQIKKRGAEVQSYKSTLYGKHNILNLTSVVVLAQELGFSFSAIQESLFLFKGVKRRQELLGTPQGVTIIEDFAHHPTAVSETIFGLKSKFPERKIWAVFEPRSATSRRKVFQKDYVKAFELADVTVLMQAFDQSKIAAGDRFSVSELVADLKEKHKRALSFNNVEDIVNCLSQEIKSGDVVVLMSNGGFGGIYQKLLVSLA